MPTECLFIHPANECVRDPSQWVNNPGMLEIWTCKSAGRGLPMFGILQHVAVWCRDTLGTTRHCVCCNGEDTVLGFQGTAAEHAHMHSTQTRSQTRTRTSAHTLKPRRPQYILVHRFHFQHVSWGECWSLDPASGRLWILNYLYLRAAMIYRLHWLHW